MKLSSTPLGGRSTHTFESLGLTRLEDIPPSLADEIRADLTVLLPQNERDEDEDPYVRLYHEDEFGLFVPRHYTNPRLSLLGRVVVPEYHGHKFVHNLQFSPRPEQQALCNEILEVKGDFGIQAPCGFGKTYLAAFVGAQQCGRVLIIVPNNNKANEWRREMARFYGLDTSQIGLIQGSTRKWLEYPVVIGMAKTIAMQNFSREEQMAFGLVVNDEGHLNTARVNSRANAKFSGRRLILTATPGKGTRRDILDLHYGKNWLRPQATEMQCRFEMLPVPVWNKFENMDWERLSTLIGRDFKYVDVAVNITRQLLEQGRRVLVVNHQIDPLATIYSRTGERGGFVIGRDSVKRVAASFPHLQKKLDARTESSWPKRADGYMTDVKKSANPVLGIGLTKTQPAGTGMDVPDLDGGLIMMPVASPDMVTQLLGRWTRVHPGKQQPLIVVMYPNTDSGRQRADTMNAHLRRAGHIVIHHPPVSL